MAHFVLRSAGFVESSKDLVRFLPTLCERKKESVSVREREGERGEGAKITQAAGTIQIEDLQRG